MYIIDRYEGEYAICEDENKKMHPLRRSDLPSEAKEGDCIRFDGQSYVVDVDETQRRKARVRKLMSSLFEG